MLEGLHTFIKKHQLFFPGERILLAVSGGADSVALSHLFSKAGLKFGIAHCNFQLRGKASDGDEAFVRNLAQTLNSPFYSTRFDTQKIMAEQGRPMQVTARELRYEWLEKTRQQKGYQWIATAHHLNDSIETALYNFTKGSGIRGLHGIPVKNGCIIRPLLFASRTDIERFLDRNQFAFREDVSNQHRKYSRNRLRLDVVPTLREINPGLEKTMQDNFQRIRETEWLFDYAVAHFKDRWMQATDSGIVVQLDPLRKHPAAATLLHEWLSGYGFSMDQLRNALDANTQTGAMFYSATNRLLVDRDRLLVDSKKQADRDFKIEPDTKLLDLGGLVLHVEYQDGQPATFFSPELGFQVDVQYLIFPITVRHWKAGDVFQPLGMKGHQKVQDFFSNLKLSRFEKEKTWLLVNGDESIIGILGYRLDDRFKTTQQTNSHLQLRIMRADQKVER
mgnify:CR=1 FL=1